jgi:ABC-type histidine transport system ATPase subunit
MLRWKLFIPLAVGLTALALLGSYFWSATASNRYLSALNNQSVAEIAVQGNRLSISIDSGQALTEILEGFDAQQLNKLAAGKVLDFQRKEMQSIDSVLANKIELVVAQAAETREYYQASLLLEELAKQWGHEAEMFIWEGRIVAEVGSSQHSYITQRWLKGEVSQ